MDFGTIVLGTTATDTFTVTNRGASISGVPSIGVEARGAPDPVLFTVTNVGDAAAGPIAASIVGEFGSDHAISDSDCTALTPQETCTLSVVCRPPMSAAGGPRGAVLSITDGRSHVAIPLTAQVSLGD